ncbi:MAG: hypothetical protein ACRDBM_15790, partial [Sporomusa sp.]
KLYGKGVAFFYVQSHRAIDLTKSGIYTKTDNKNKGQFWRGQIEAIYFLKTNVILISENGGIVMIVQGVKVVAEQGITAEEIQAIVDEELQLWNNKGKTLAQVQLSIEDQEIVVKAIERSPIKRVRRITGYLSTEDRFNNAKQSELFDRRAHI